MSSKLHPDPIPQTEVERALYEWMEFWDLPYVLKNKEHKGQKWAHIFTRGVNRSRIARKHWHEAKEQVFAMCDRFPWPKDVIAAAYRLENDQDTIQRENHECMKKERPQDAASPAKVSRMVQDTIKGMKAEEPDQ